MVISILALNACKKDDLKVSPAPTQDELSLDDAYTGEHFAYEAVYRGIEGPYSEELTKALVMNFLDKPSTKVTPETKMLIVPRLSSDYEDDIVTVYENGGIIVIGNPSSTNVKKWFDDHNWTGMPSADRLDNAMLYSFSKYTHSCVVEAPDNDDYLVSQEDAEKMEDNYDEDFFFSDVAEGDQDIEEDEGYDTEGEEIMQSYDDGKYDSFYTYLSSWMRLVNDDLASADARTKAADGLSDVSTIFRYYPYSRVYTYSAKAKVRQLPSSSPDYIIGEGTIGVSFDIYQIHCYEGEPGAGDYYLVNMTAHVANDDIYKGKWWNVHGWSCVRICGLFGRSFAVACTPVDPDTHEPLKAETVSFTAGGFPSPATCVGKTSYSKSSSFSLDAGLSVSGTLSQKDGLEGTISGNIALGWSWSNSESRDVSDMDIMNTSKGNSAGYKLVFNNLPKPDWSFKRGFDEGPSQTYRSTTEIRSSWVWRVSGVKDDSDVKPICIRFDANPVYGALTFVSTYGVDGNDDTFTEFGNVRDYIELTPFLHDKCGTFILNNDFTDGTAIKSVRVYDASHLDGNPVWESHNTIKPGSQIETSALKTSLAYTICFTTMAGKEYKYATHEALYLDKGERKEVYANTDCKQVK